MKFNINHVIVVALLPFYGYIAAYFYEAGYLSSFNISSILVQVNLESLVVSSIIILFVAVIIFDLLHFLLPFYVNKEPYSITKKITITSSMTILPLAIVCYIYPPIIFTRSSLILLGLFLIYLLLDFGLPLFKYRKESLSLKEKLKKAYEAEIQGEQRWHTYCLATNQTFMNLLLLAVFAVAIALVALSIGIKLGLNQTEYFTFTRDGSEYALIRNYRSEKIGVKMLNSKFTNDYLLLDNATELKLSRKFISR